MKESIKHVCGEAASRLFPATTQSIADGKTVPRGALEKLISSSLIRKAAQSGDHETLRNRLSQYWQGDAGDAFYDTFADRFENLFLGDHYPVVEALKSIVDSSGGEYSHLYEIGCGDGKVLNHLAEKLNGVSHFTGLDINEKIIVKNRKTWQSEYLQFESADATKWISQHAEPSTILMSYGGVMEYFLEHELADMFAVLKAKSPAAVALVEPLYDDFDSEKEISSRSSGREHSFSHNHRHLLETAGFEITFQKELRGEFRWMMIVAKG